MIIGIIGGSGIYEIEDLEDPQWITINSTFGMPSDDVLIGQINGHAHKTGTWCSSTWTPIYTS